jgi:ubiquinone/menaquinone biosynthesis C-methylase UbiE
VESNNSEEKKLHYNLTKEYFKESATYKMGYYDTKSKLNLKHDSKQYKIWEICTSFFDKKINSKIKKIIDVGCGIGDFTIDLAKRYSSLNKIVGVDFLEETIEIARKNTKDFEKVIFEKKDILNLDFDERSFDVSICVNVFHHIHPKDQEKAVKELSKISDKYVVLEIRNKKNIFNFWYKYIALPFLYRNLPVTSNSVAEINSMFKKQKFKLLIAKGIYPRIWICRRLILIYKRADLV